MPFSVEAGARLELPDSLSTYRARGVCNVGGALRQFAELGIEFARPPITPKAIRGRCKGGFDAKARPHASVRVRGAAGGAGITADGDDLYPAIVALAVAAGDHALELGECQVDHAAIPRVHRLE